MCAVDVIIKLRSNEKGFDAIASTHYAMVQLMVSRKWIRQPWALYAYLFSVYAYKCMARECRCK